MSLRDLMRSDLRRITTSQCEMAETVQYITDAGELSAVGIWHSPSPDSGLEMGAGVGHYSGRAIFSVGADQIARPVDGGKITRTVEGVTEEWTITEVVWHKSGTWTLTLAQPESDGRAPGTRFTL